MGPVLMAIPKIVRAAVAKGARQDIWIQLSGVRREKTNWKAISSSNLQAQKTSNLGKENSKTKSGGKLKKIILQELPKIVLRRFLPVDLLDPFHWSREGEVE